MTYRELQSALKSLRNDGADVQVKLNAKKAILQTEYDRLSAPKDIKDVHELDTADKDILCNDTLQKVDSTADGDAGVVAPSTLGTEKQVALSTTNQNTQIKKPNQPKLMSVVTSYDSQRGNWMYSLRNYHLAGEHNASNPYLLGENKALFCHMEDKPGLEDNTVTVPYQQSIEPDMVLSWKYDDSELFLLLAMMPFILWLSIACYGVLATVLFSTAILYITVPSIAKVLDKVIDFTIKVVDYPLSLQYQTMRVINKVLLKVILSRA